MYEPMDYNPKPKVLEIVNQIYESIWAINKAGQQGGWGTQLS